MKIRPGRTRSIIGGVAAVMVTVVGLIMMSSTGGLGGPMGIFMILWVIIGLVAAGASFYNGFSDRGLPLYEVETGEREGAEFCPQCGRSVVEVDKYCRHCGFQLGEE
jgi:hypothetical protein